MQSIAVPLTRCLAVLTYIPIFAFFPWTVSLSRSILAMLDCLSYNWLLAQLHSPGNEFKLVITLIHEDLESWRHRLDLPKHAPMTSFPNPEGVIAQDNSELNLREKLQILIMPKITYPRPCPTCGKELNRGISFDMSTVSLNFWEERYYAIPRTAATFEQPTEFFMHDLWNGINKC